MTAPLTPIPSVAATTGAMPATTTAKDARWPVRVRAEVAKMRDEWDMVDDVEQGTPALRANASKYLPQFPTETPEQYKARVLMTFAENHYRRALDELVGLAFTKDPTLDEDVPPAIADLMENVTGESEHIDVFMRRAARAGLHHGHAAILTDYPRTTKDDGTALREHEARTMNLRPYARLILARDILGWDITSFGGVNVLTRVAFIETYDFEGAALEQVRELEQDVLYDERGIAVSLGTITFKMWRLEKVGDKAEWVLKDNGELDGPTRVPFRVFYGGHMLAPMVTRPANIDLAYTNVEHTQVASDRANVMHKCNVPTPVFTGLRLKKGEDVAMGQGIVLEDNGTATMLEPSGVALNASAARLDELRAEMRRQGAALPDGAGRTMTATEAALYAKQRNARLVRMVRSLQDAAEGMLSDFAAFMKLGVGGGSIVLSKDFSAHTFDVPYLVLLKESAIEGLIPVDAYDYALQHGKLPDDFDHMEAALKAMAAMEAQRAAEAEQARAMAEAVARSADAPGDPPPNPPPNAPPSPKPSAPPKGKPTTEPADDV